MSWVSQVLNYSIIPSSHHIREQTEYAKYAMVSRHCNTRQKYKIWRKMKHLCIYEIHICKVVSSSILAARNTAELVEIGPEKNSASYGI